MTEATTASVPTALAAPFPNPFNGAVTIRYSLQAPAVGAHMTIYSVNGQRIRHWRLDDERAGSQEIVWDGRDQEGRPVASGSYSVELKAGTRTRVQRLTHLK